MRLLIAILGSLALGAGNTAFDSANKVKDLLREMVYADHRVTFYCGCDFDADLNVSHAKCGYKPKRDTRRSHRVEWEHVVPAEAFGQAFVEWREGHDQCVDSEELPFRGRRCAEKMSETYRRMQADMYNIVPAIGEVNARRQNYSMTELPGEVREHGACDIEFRDRKVEPPSEIRGDVARIYLYMDYAYPGRGIISRKRRKLFEAWDRLDQVSAWECKRGRMIEDLQGNPNPVLEARCTRLRP